MKSQSIGRLLDQHSFLLGSSCPVKLSHSLSGYPRIDTDDPFLAHLAAERRLLVALARSRFKDPVPLTVAHPSEADHSTGDLLRSENVTVFDAVAIAEVLVAKVDIARNQRNKIELFMVRATAARWSEYNRGRLFETSSGSIRAAWRPSLEEAAFVSHVFATAFPDREISTNLVMPDQDRVATVGGLPKLLQATSSPISGDLLGSSVLRAYDVTKWCTQLRGSVTGQANKLVQQSRDLESSPKPELRYRCRKCEFRVAAGIGPSGFQKCWGKLGEPDPHLFDLYQLWSVKNLENKPLADDLIACGATSLFDMPDGALTGEHAARQRLQIRATQERRECLAPELTRAVWSWPLPLHFVDFETVSPAVPHHAGMAPFETVAFQWSCHTLEEFGGKLRHLEWLNDTDSYPNVDFVRSLRAAIGNIGSVLIWTEHETKTLNELCGQFERLHPSETELIAWIRDLLRPGGRIIDMNAMCIRYYYHPDNRGRSSLKKVLPPIWRIRPDLWNHPYFVGTGDGTDRDPYICLPPATLENEYWEVREGCAAMRAYREIIFGPKGASPTHRAALRGLLLRYCRLDTLSMVLIWLHWSKWRREDDEILYSDDALGMDPPDLIQEQIQEGQSRVARYSSVALE